MGFSGREGGISYVDPISQTAAGWLSFALRAQRPQGPSVLMSRVRDPVELSHKPIQHPEHIFSTFLGQVQVQVCPGLVLREDQMQALSPARKSVRCACLRKAHLRHADFHPLKPFLCCLQFLERKHPQEEIGCLCPPGGMPQKRTGAWGHGSPREASTKWGESGRASWRRQPLPSPEG